VGVTDLKIAHCGREHGREQDVHALGLRSCLQAGRRAAPGARRPERGVGRPPPPGAHNTAAEIMANNKRQHTQKSALLLPLVAQTVVVVVLLLHSSMEEYSAAAAAAAPGQHDDGLANFWPARFPPPLPTECTNPAPFLPRFHFIGRPSSSLNPGNEGAGHFPDNANDVRRLV
jgi:hypothetical protein